MESSHEYCTGTSSLMLGGSPEVTASCRTTGGLSVNGIGTVGSLSTLMMGTVGVELNNYINPGWTWKTVTKGFRSATRRTRKSVPRNWTMGFGLADRSAGNADDAFVSDTEKLGVAVLGRRFGDKVEHVPIKKRKIIFCSSPPPPPPPNMEVTEQPVNFEHGSNQLSSVNSGSKKQRMKLNGSIANRNSSMADQEIFEGKEQKFVCSDDFSGIEILAAVACSDGMDVGDDNGDNSSVEGLMREQIEPSISTVPLEETIASSEIINTSPKDIVGKYIVEPFSFQDGSSVKKYHDASDDTSTNQPLPVRDHRLHWDLNVVMDVWEQPGDITSDDQQPNVLESVSLDGDEGVQLAVVEKPEDTKEDLGDRVVSSDLLWDVTPNSELRGLDGDNKKIDVEGQEPKMCFVLEGNTDKFAATLNGLECSTESLSSVKASAQTMNVAKSLDIRVNNSSEGVYEGSLAVSPSYTTVKQMTGRCALDSEILRADSVLPKVTDVSCPVEDVDTVCYEINGNILYEDSEESGGGFDMHLHDTKDSQEMETGSVGVKTSERAEGVGVRCGSPMCENIHASSAADSIAEINSSVHAESEEPMQKSCGAPAVVEECQAYGNGPLSGSCKVGKGDPSDDSYDSNVSQNDTVHIAGKDNSKVLQAGYDSQFEDGELREEDLHYWEGNEGEDGEVEHVDYGSEFEEDRFCDMEVESNQKEMKDETGLTPATDEVIKYIEHCSKGDDSKEKPLSLDKRITDVSDGSKTKKHTDECVDQHDAKDYHSRASDFRACKRELPSRIEGPLSSDTLHRKDRVFFPRSREACVDKFVGRERHGRSPVRRNFLNSSGGYWESKHRQSPTYCGSYASGRPRPRSIVEGRRYRTISDNMILEEAEEAGFENRTRKQNWNSSNGVYRPLVRRPPAGREDAYDVDTGMVHVRDTSPRSRLRRYPQGFRRGIREDYHRSLPDNSTQYSNCMPHRFARRDRSLSPFSGGRPHYNFPKPFQKSRSRSRSRTPSAWFSSREQNDGVRHRSRSPFLRSNDRVDRVRFPFQKRFAADYEEGFMSPPRGRISPQHDSRWFDDRNSALDPCRGQKSPVRAFRRNHRFDPVRVARRLNSDEYFRPAMRLRRFSDIPSAARSCEYEGSDDDRRKRNNRYEMN